ncbi:hypothetical protein M8494_31070 [Serratia ureilytica]
MDHYRFGALFSQIARDQPAEIFGAAGDQGRFPLIEWFAITVSLMSVTET